MENLVFFSLLNQFCHISYQIYICSSVRTLKWFSEEILHLTIDCMSQDSVRKVIHLDSKCSDRRYTNRHMGRGLPEVMRQTFVYIRHPPWENIPSGDHKLVAGLELSWEKLYVPKQKKKIIICYGPLARYVKLRFAHALGMPGAFSPPPRVSDPDMHHGTCVMYVPWCMPASITIAKL